MAPPKKVVNIKQESGRAKKAEHESQKQAAADAQRNAEDASDWAVGSNAKRSARDEEAALKEEEAARKRREKAALLAAEEDGTADNTAGAKRAVAGAKKGTTKKKNNDLSFLEDSLISAADKKAKQKKAAEAAAAAKLQTDAAQRAATAAAATVAMDPLLLNTQQMIGDESGSVGRLANQVRMQDANASGMDAALGSLDISSSAIPAPTRVTYADFEHRHLPNVKAENPGLRLSQYKEKVFLLWKKSPENPANHQAPPLSS